MYLHLIYLQRYICNQQQQLQDRTDHPYKHTALFYISKYS